MTLKKLTIAAVVLGLANILPGMVKHASAARLPVHLMALSFDPQKASGEDQKHQGEPQELDKDVENEVDDKDMANDEKDDVDLQENDKDEHGVQSHAATHDEVDADDKDAREDRDSDRNDDMQQERDNEIPPR